MRKTFSLLVAAPLLAATLFASSAARADGAVVRRLPDADHSSLTADVAKARQAAPADFQAVDRVASRLADLDASRRGRLIPVTPLLKAIGPRALLPMLERAALTSNPRGSLSDVAWRSWRIGLIESIGLLHDTRALPLFSTVLAGSDTDHDLLKVTSESIGRVGDEAAITRLVALARQAGPRQIPLLAGLGESHRTVAAQALADAAHGQLGGGALASLGDEGRGGRVVDHQQGGGGRAADVGRAGDEQVDQGAGGERAHGAFLVAVSVDELPGPGRADVTEGLGDEASALVVEGAELAVGRVGQGLGGDRAVALAEARQERELAGAGLAGEG
ncbi:MAG: hypothetical protein EOO75_05315, partial [Myxococcales bacterium]